MKLPVSKQTTGGGLLFSLSMIFQELSDLLDHDPATTFDIAMITAAIGAFYALWKARDDNKSSEDVGIMPRH